MTMDLDRMAMLARAFAGLQGKHNESLHPTHKPHLFSWCQFTRQKPPSTTREALLINECFYRKFLM